MARIEGTGIKEPSKKASQMAGKKIASSFSGGSSGGNYVDAGDRRGFVSTDQAGKMLANPEAYRMRPSEVRYLRESMGLDKVQAPTETFEKRDFFSMVKDPRNEVKVASANLSSLDVGDSFTKQAESNLADTKVASVGDSFDENDFKGYLKAVGIRYPRTLPDTFMRGLRENYQMDKKEGIYKDGQIFNRTDTLLNKAPVKEKPSFIEQTKNIAGSIFNAATGTQTAAAGEMPSGTQFSPSGDTSFASYRMAGGTQQQQGSGIVTPFSQTSMGKGEPRNVTKFQDTSMGRKPVANLPSDYKQTEAREFAKAAAFQQAKKNPNVTTSLDSKGQVVVKPVQKGRGESGTSDRTAQGNQARVQQNAKARAQAAAIQRKISGKSISQTKAANKAAVRKSAAERQAAFKKTRKSTVGARRAAAKKSVQAAAKKRHSAFKKRRAARRKSKKGKK